MSAVRRIRVSGLALAIACAFPAGEAAAAGTGSRASSAAPETVVAPLGGEGRLDIRGVRGEIFVQLGRPGEIRFLASPGAPGGEAPEIALRRETGRILLGPAGEGAEAEGKLEVAVPPETSVFVETSDGKVWASGLRGGLDVRGERIVVEGRGLRGGASVAVEGGEISLLHVEGDVSVESGAADVELSTIEGRVVVGASGDLARKKIFPALFALYCQGRLPEPLRLFGEEDDPILRALRKLDTDRMTPLEALQRLADLKRQAGERRAPELGSE